MYRVTTVWTGFSGGPGYTNFYFLGGDDNQPGAASAAAKVRVFFAAIQMLIPGPTQLQVQSTVGVVDPITGVLSNEWTVDPAPAVITCQGNSERSAPSGAVVNWKTGSIVNGRRLRGRTFIVPLSIQNYDAAGTLLNSAQGVMQTAATALATSGGPGSSNLGVWHRPAAGVGGSIGIVTGAQVPDKACVLTSRRD